MSKPPQNILPTTEDIAPAFEHDLDQREALWFFYGKTLEEIEDKLSENASERISHYDCIGTRAFAYYLPAMMTYLRSEKSTGDVDFVDRLIGVFARRTINVVDLVPESLSGMAEAVTYCINNYHKFDPSKHEEEVREELKVLCQVIEKLQKVRSERKERGSGVFP